MLILLNCTKRVSHNLFTKLNATLSRVITRVSPSSSRLQYIYSIPYCKFPAFFLCTVVFCVSCARLCALFSVSLGGAFLLFSSSSYHSLPPLLLSRPSLSVIFFLSPRLLLLSHEEPASSFFLPLISITAPLRFRCFPEGSYVTHSVQEFLPGSLQAR